MISILRVLAAAILGTAAGISVSAGQSLPRTFGTATSILTVPAASFAPNSSFTEWSSSLGERWRSGGSGGFEAGVLLPAGALITNMDFEACDESPWSIIAQFFSCAGDQCATLAEITTGGPEAPGCTVFSTPTSAHVVDNVARRYLLSIQTGSGDASTRFRAVRISYHLQVSPAPGVATFADVPTSHLFFRAIEALAASGATSGCGGGNFCPNQYVTRGELAKFLANALGLSWK